MNICKYTNIQIYKYTNITITNLQICKYTKYKYKFEYKFKYKFTNIKKTGKQISCSIERHLKLYSNTKHPDHGPDALAVRPAKINASI